MARVERHPGTFGLRRPDRSVSLERPLQNASTDTRLRGSGRPSSDSSIPDWALNIVNSTLGSILGRGSLPETQRAAAEWAAQGLSLPTPGGAMRQEGTVNAIDTALNLVRPLALADVGVAGAAGSMMFPFPGLAPGAAPAVGAARKAGGGIAGALSGLLGRGGDEAARAGDDLIGETFGLRTVRGSGNSVADPWQSTLRETTTRTTEDGRRVAAEIAEFDALPDDAWVRAYHGTTPESARLLRSEGQAGGRGLRQAEPSYAGHEWSSEVGVFLTPTPTSAATYAREGGEVVEMLVRKGDLRTPHQFGLRMPVGEAPNTGTLGESFFNTLTGVYIPEGGPLRAIRSHRITPELKQEIGLMQIRASRSEPVLPPTPNPGSVV
mgnify:CR=1 FL=1